jgi:acyl-CoA dehydrogenase
MQTHGAMGVSQDTPLARMYSWIRALRFADGPDEVHRMTIARRELRRWAPSA